MPPFLASVNPHLVYDELRNMLTKGEYKDKFKFSTMMDIMDERIQRACFLLKLASAYDGYTFYLPAFIDFIGRIYRTGIMHFHERNLLRSLLRRLQNNLLQKSNICMKSCLPDFITIHFNL